MPHGRLVLQGQERGGIGGFVVKHVLLLSDKAHIAVIYRVLAQHGPVHRVLGVLHVMVDAVDQVARLARVVAVSTESGSGLVLQHVGLWEARFRVDSSVARLTWASIVN